MQFAAPDVCKDRTVGIICSARSPSYIYIYVRIILRSVKDSSRCSELATHARYIYVIKTVSYIAAIVLRSEMSLRTNLLQPLAGETVGLRAPRLPWFSIAW